MTTPLLGAGFQLTSFANNTMAQAISILTAQGEGDGKTGLGGFFGVPDFSFLSPARVQIQTLTGWIIAAVLLVAGAGILFGALKITVAGKNDAEYTAGLKWVKRALIGASIAIAGPTLYVMLVTAMLAIF